MTTLLSITQDILSDMSGDDVNSIFDTEEAEQVARIVVSTFNAIVSNADWAQHKKLVQLTSPADNTTPSHMTLPSNVKEVLFIHYDIIQSGETKKNYTEMKWKHPDDFLRYVNMRDSTSSTIQTVTDASGVELLIYNERPPEYYTSFDDDTLVFDAFDSDVESTLQGSKTQVHAKVQPTLSLLDTAVPDLPVEAISLLVEESTSRAQNKIAEFNDVKAEQEAGRQRRTLSRKNWKVNSGRRYPNYGKR